MPAPVKLSNPSQQGKQMFNVDDYATLMGRKNAGGGDFSLLKEEGDTGTLVFIRLKTTDLN